MPAGMFHPQSTPLDLFAPYMSTGYDFDNPGFAINGGGGILFDNPTFASTAADDFRPATTSLSANTRSNLHAHSQLAHQSPHGQLFGNYKMEATTYDDDLSAQQAAARDYAPNLEVSLVGPEPWAGQSRLIGVRYRVRW
jgi:hypothetical protein